MLPWYYHTSGCIVATCPQTTLVLDLQPPTIFCSTYLGLAVVFQTLLHLDMLHVLCLLRLAVVFFAILAFLFATLLRGYLATRLILTTLLLFVAFFVRSHLGDHATLAVVLLLGLQLAVLAMLVLAHAIHFQPNTLHVRLRPFHLSLDHLGAHFPRASLCFDISVHVSR